MTTSRRSSAVSRPPPTITRAPRISPRRCSTIPPPAGARTIATAPMISAMNRNARSGRRIVTLHLDLDDLADPEEADRLQHHGADDHHLSQAFVEQELHLVGRDERQRHRQKRR